MPGARDELAGLGIQGQVDHRHELALLHLLHDDFVRGAEEVGGPGCSRASERTNFVIAMSAAASIPLPVTSPTTTASRPSDSVA